MLAGLLLVALLLVLRCDRDNSRRGTGDARPLLVTVEEAETREAPLRLPVAGRVGRIELEPGDVVQSA
jgi:hypothetical protein